MLNHASFEQKMPLGLLLPPLNPEPESRKYGYMGLAPAVMLAGWTYQADHVARKNLAQVPAAQLDYGRVRSKRFTQYDFTALRPFVSLTELLRPLTPSLKRSAMQATPQTEYQQQVVLAQAQLTHTQHMLTSYSESIGNETMNQLRNLQRLLLGPGAALSTGAQVSTSLSAPVPPAPRPLASRPGMRLFEIEGQQNWALNEKNARRKARNPRR
jgi:hypothetical protein